MLLCCIQDTLTQDSTGYIVMFVASTSFVYFGSENTKQIVGLDMNISKH